jgi:hypothetical protein
MGRGKVVIAPDGGRWRVRRRWLDRPMPNLRKRFRRDGRAGDGVIEGLAFAPDLTDGWFSLGLAVVVLLIVFILLPLLGVALELIALLFFLWSGIVARVVFGRPWTVEARPLGDGDGGDRVVEFPVKGWRRAGEAADRLAGEIEVTGRPEQFVSPEADAR